MGLNKGQVVFLFVIAAAMAYFLTGVLCFALNDAVKMIPKKFSLDFTYKAVINDYPQIYKALGIASVFSLALVSIIPFLPKKQSLYGKARFATAAEVRKMNLFGDEGIIIGKFLGKLLRFGGQQFVSLGAGTRSGKGVGVIIPNLLDWKYSVVSQDIKQENFDFTSKYRQKVLKNEVFLFNPFDERTHRYNPLHYIDMNGNNADGELMDFANILYPLIGDSNTQFFNMHAQNLFTGICYMCHDLLDTRLGVSFLKANNLNCSFTLYGILELSEGLRFYVDNGEGTKTKINGFKDTYDTLCAAGVLREKTQKFIDAYFAIESANTRSGVLSSFNAPLMIFRNDNVRLATSGNDFDFRDLRKKKMTIYIGITPDQINNARLILNIFWQQLLLSNTKELPQKNPDIKHKVLLIMDEFTAIGYLPIYLKSIAFIAGYWLRSLIAYQSDSQIEAPQPEGYGKEGAKTLLKNHACQIYYAPKEEDAERISRLLGYKTVKSRSRNIGRGGGGSESDVKRALMLPQELQEMDFKNEIIRIDNGKPIFCEKAFYYVDPYFIKKFKTVSPSLAKKKGKTISEDDLKEAALNGETKIDVPVQSISDLEARLKQDIEYRHRNFIKGNK